MTGERFSVAGLFAGIGGIERGLGLHGGEAELLCEYWDPAHRVLEARFSGVPLVEDVRDLRSLPKVDLVSAGFPCTDLSQAGRMDGINGRASGLVGEVFRLIRRPRAPMLMLENVRNMLVLDGGAAMHYLVDELEALGYRWAYRLVDSRFTGVPQRRQRVIFLASRTIDPRAVLFADDEGEPGPEWFADNTSGFYWTEGLRGLGWARDAVPTLKGGSTIGIPSQPAIWNPSAPLGQRIVLPVVEEAEQMQGFPARWTEPADEGPGRKGPRWKLTGNAVTVGVSAWVGRRLRNPGDPILDGQPLRSGDRWPTAAFGAKGKAWAVDVSLWPTREPYTHLHEIVDLESAQPLSARATAGFLSRTERGSLRFVDGFIDDVAEHAAYMAEELSVA
ncbi:DNA cytosine methyltransferase [Dermatobacter hominis]|uniref:DNA cytosine methyltransferase n=1 Tax=Dermatobacter hominis TaxID=2884263 RepID=UPI001D10159D|nr:DNA (cytosine-5-)-methyltransferase [Dermatobacter hominis]UDY34529.1 DNA (cytosine-5-)-methyltransferase [Dermatobacter hominis]